MERRKIIIYSIFVAVAIYGFYFHFLSGETRRPQKVTVTKASISPPATAKYEFTETDHMIIDPGNKPDVIDSSWGRNPFKYKNTNAEKKISYSSGEKIYKRPRVSAISAAGPEKFAVADGKVLNIGSSAGVWKLLEVENGRALFQGPDEKIWINIGGRK